MTSGPGGVLLRRAGEDARAPAHRRRAVLPDRDRKPLLVHGVGSFEADGCRQQHRTGRRRPAARRRVEIAAYVEILCAEGHDGIGRVRKRRLVRAVLVRPEGREGAERGRRHGEIVEHAVAGLRECRELYDTRLGIGGVQRRRRQGDLAGILVDDNRVVPGRAVRRHLDGQVVVADQADLGAAGEPRLQEQREHVARRLLVHRIAEVAVAPLARRLGGPQRLVELRRKRVRGVGRRADSEQREVLQGVERGCDIDPRRPVEDEQRVLVLHPGAPALARRAKAPGAVLPHGDVPSSPTHAPVAPAATM